jgi:hypothetical protein
MEINKNGNTIELWKQVQIDKKLLEIEYRIE